MLKGVIKLGHNELDNADKSLYSLRDLMDAKGYSIRDLAAKAGVSKSSIEDILRGHRAKAPGVAFEPHARTMRAIAQTLSVEIIQIREFTEAIERKRGKENDLLLSA